MCESGKNPISARGTARERAIVIPHPPPITHRGAELEAELESELEIFARPRAGVHFHTLKCESYGLEILSRSKFFLTYIRLENIYSFLGEKYA